MTDDANVPKRRPTPTARAVPPPVAPAPPAPAVPAVPPVPAAPTPPVVVPGTPVTPAATQGEYTGSVVAPMQIVLGVGSGALIAIILTALSSDLWPIAVLIFLIAAGVGVYLAPVTVSVEHRRVTISQGRRERDPLVIYVAEIRDAGLRDVTFAQCFGFGGIESDDRTTRLAVRPGPTLVLTLVDGQRILVSVTDGPAVLHAIEAAAPA